MIQRCGWLGSHVLRGSTLTMRDGVVNLLPIDLINAHAGARRPGSSRVCGGGKTRDVLPGVESFPQLLTVLGGGQAVTPWAAVLGDGPVGGEEALRVARGLEALQAPLPLARRLMRMLRPVVQIAGLAMFDARRISRFAAP
jgi:hypothetical protein